MIAPTTRRALVVAAVVTLLAALAVQAVASMRLKSCTSDEVTHLPSGYSYLITGDHRLNRQHPPLLKLLAALPLRTLDPPPRLDLEDPAWLSIPPDEWSFGRRFLYGHDADALLFRGRLPTVALALLLGLYVFIWARALWGDGGGLLALLLYVTCPSLLAHARWVTMDVGLSAFYLAACYHLWAYLRRGGFADLLCCAMGLGCAMASKFSGAFLAPVLALLTASWVLRPFPGRGAGAATDTAHDPRATARRALAATVGLAAIGAVAAVVVWATYGFPFDPLFYARGLLRVNADHDPDYDFYLLGEFRQGGWWWYFLAALVFKSRLAVLLLVLAAATLALARRLRADPLDELFLLLPPLVFLVATSAMAADIGVRYVLPLYPFAFVALGRLATWRPPRRWLAAAALAPLLAWAAIAGVASYPHYLGFFNALGGGPASGHLLLDDSNVDWGQDLKLLARAQRDQGLGHLRLLYPWIVAGDPDYYGLDWEPITVEDWESPTPSPGLYAISTNMLIRGRHDARTRGVATDWLERHEPVGRVGWSFYLFEFE